tara:strand:- start:4701 stop:5483 length:783 start_codon:yes stop_codon:yes gene_type:complete
MSGKDEGRLNIVLIPSGDRETRSFSTSYRALRAFGLVVALAAMGVSLIIFTWWPLAVRSARASELEQELVRMGRDLERVEDLVQQLGQMEAQYLQLRDMFGSGDAGVGAPRGLFPPLAEPSPDAQSGGGPVRGSPPSFWPLSERGFVTQGLHSGAAEGHPGLDIAVPSGSYIWSAGDGVVVEVGEDAVYGRFVVIDHGSEVRTLYGHTSETFVERGEEVHARQVVALSGSTGRSSAPHLHFEVIVEGKPVDPLGFVEQPG